MPPKTVLVVEPDEYQREIIRAALEHHGYVVVEVHPDALRSYPIDERPPDLLVVAHSTHDDGRLLEWIRTTPAVGRIPILCVAEDTRPWEVEEAIEAGCATVCVKPLDPGHFAVQVRQLIGPSIA